MADEEQEDESSYKLPSDPGIEVYQNKNGHIVIMQESLYGDDDQYVQFSPERAEKVIEYIRAVKEEIMTDRADEASARNERRYVPGIDP